MTGGNHACRCGRCSCRRLRLHGRSCAVNGRTCSARALKELRASAMVRHDDSRCVHDADFFAPRAVCRVTWPVVVDACQR